MATVVTDLRSAFPTLAGRPDVVYLDSAATSQTPAPVIAAMDDYYVAHRASVHRGLYPLAAEATNAYEGARRTIAEWLNWGVEETIFTRNATEALNLVAYSYGRERLRPGDAVLITQMEHHSVVVPWQQACLATGAELRYLAVDDDGLLDLAELDAELARGDVRVVAFAHVSNVLGTINPVAEMVRRVRAAGAISIIDGSQAVPQMPVDVGAIDADFYVWTGHKAYGPTGIGVLHGRRELLDAMPPFLSGGHMITRVDDLESSWAPLPAKFEAGTGAIAEAIGLGAAVEFLSAIGMDALRAHEADVTGYALERLAEVPGLRLHGPADVALRGALVSFSLPEAHPHDVAEILARSGVCVRAGHHCAQPLMRRLGEGATTRASFAVHSTRDEVDALIDGLHEVRRIFG